MSMNSVYQILKAIDVAFENQDFNLERDLNLEKLDISEHRRTQIIDELYKNGYIEGLSVSWGRSSSAILNISNPFKK